MKEIGNETTPSAALSEEKMEEVVGGSGGEPEEFDWREMGHSSPVNRNSSVGSPWSFSAEANVEGQYFKRINRGTGNDQG